MPTINLATKYSDKIITKFTKSSFLAGVASTEYDFAGVKSITIYTPKTQALADYNRSASANRFGTPTEMEDTIQELTMTQDKSFSITIDKGNQSDQMNIKEAGKMLKLQLDEQNIPFMDKYAFDVYARKAGKVAGLASAPTKSTIVGILADALTHLDNMLVPMEKRTIFIGATLHNALRLSDQYLAIDPLGQASLSKGMVGTFMDVPVVKVPDSYLGKVYFLITYKDAILFPLKFKTLNLHTKAPGIDGALLEGRHYFDAFVLGTKADGIYSAVPTADVVATPVITPTGASHAITCATGSATIMYTIDGSDPRYSKSALTYSGAVVLTSGQTIKSYAFKTAMYDSEVASATYTA